MPRGNEKATLAWLGDKVGDLYVGVIGHKIGASTHQIDQVRQRMLSTAALSRSGTREAAEHLERRVGRALLEDTPALEAILRRALVRGKHPKGDFAFQIENAFRQVHSQRQKEFTF